MNRLAGLLFTLLAAACGDPDAAETMLAGENGAPEVTVCSCINEPITTNAKANACTELMGSLTPEEITLKTMACRATSGVPEDGPDLCYCLQAINPDPSVAQDCEDIIPKNMTPTEISARIAECSSE